MPKTPDERIDLLEKRVNVYRLLFLGTFVLVLFLQRRTIVGWMDSVEGWMSNAANVRAS